jgi:hypothetical protein
MVTKASADANKTVKHPVAITSKGDTSIPENKSFMVGRVQVQVSILVIIRQVQQQCDGDGKPPK